MFPITEYLYRPASLLATVLLFFTATYIADTAVSQESSNAAPSAAGSTTELQERWQYYRPLIMPEKTESGLIDFILPPEVFSHSNLDHGDLRIYDNNERTIPYALRIRQPKSRHERFVAEEFNRALGIEDSAELTLDLKSSDIEHNEVEIKTLGANFRRKVELEGSDDNQNWNELASTFLISFRRDRGNMVGNAVSYPPSRYRYLRIRVYPDPVIDKKPVTIRSASVTRKIDVPGELSARVVSLGERIPTRVHNQPGSSWNIDLGAQQMPCIRLEIEVHDAEFVRDFYVEYETTRDRFVRMNVVNSDPWQRRAGEPKKPMVVEFVSEIRASRLRLMVVDFRNPPLNLKSVKSISAARQVIIAKPEDSDMGYRLFYGNPNASAPNYDFARNLPAKIKPAPTRATLAIYKENPDYTPAPKPFSERLPWLVYVVLGGLGLILAGIIASVARKAIALHDGEPASEPEAASG